jgi:hypothetical protein
MQFPHHLNTHRDWEIACARCEIKVEVSLDLHKRLVPLLRYDKRPQGSHGYSLVQDVDDAGLLAGDRLEPSETLHDIGLFPRLTSFPIVCTFWRPSNQTMVLHRNPLISANLGVTLVDTFTIDELHTMKLGILQAWGRVAVWQLLDSPVFGGSACTSEEQLHSSVLLLREDLTRFYLERHAADPSEGLTRVHDATLKMFGARGAPKMRLSGAETWGFVLYLTHAMQRKADQLPDGAARIRQAGEVMIRLNKALTAHGANPTMAALQDRAETPHPKPRFWDGSKIRPPTPPPPPRAARIFPGG